MEFTTLEYWLWLHAKLKKAQKKGKTVDIAKALTKVWMGKFPFLHHLCIWTCGLTCGSPCFLYSSYRRDFQERRELIEGHLTEVYGKDWKDVERILMLLDRVVPIMKQKEFTLSLRFCDIDTSHELTKLEKHWLKVSYALLHPYDNTDTRCKEEYQKIS